MLKRTKPRKPLKLRKFRMIWKGNSPRKYRKKSREKLEK